MDIYPTIEALLHYANTHLLFDELDNVYARNRIMDLVKLDFYEEYEINIDEIELMANPAQLLNAISTYALMQKVIKEEERADFERKLIDCVLKRSGEIEPIFRDLPKTKSYDWLYDFGVKSGYVKLPQKRWDGRATKGKIEVAFSGAVEEGKKSQKYPACPLCRENEGYGQNLNMRGVPVELDDERMYFYFTANPAAQNEGVIVSEYHRKLTLNQTSLNKMFDFCEMLPAYVIAAREGGHEAYSVSSRPLPLNKAPDLNKFKSKDYPYIDITTIDWYFGAIRLSCTNREKLIEYADLIMNKWRAEKGNDVAVSVRKVESKYCVELMLLSLNKGVDAEFANISLIQKPFELMGMFSIDKRKENQLATIEKFLSKEEKFTPSRLEGELAQHGAMINRLLTTAGNSKISPLEAALDVKDEVNRTLEKALTSLSVPINSLFDNF